MPALPEVSPEEKCADCAMRRQGLCGRLSEATQIRLAQIATVHPVSANSHVWSVDRGPDLVGVMVSGCLRMLRNGIDGHRQICSLALPGDIISETGGRSLAHEVEAATRARLCRFDQHGFRRLLEDAPDLARAVYALRVAKLDQLRLLAWSLGALTVDERICAFLAMATRFMPYSPLPEGGGVLTVELPRADIADLLGTSVETISRITHRLAAIGAIRILDPAHFEIPDLSRVVRMGCIQDCFDSVRFSSSMTEWAQPRRHTGRVPDPALPDAARPPLSRRALLRVSSGP